jgi:long-chain acyl-CoA synthetase
VKQTMFAVAYAAKKKALEEGRAPPAIWEKIVFSKLRDKLGGRVRYMSTGSAPISAQVMEFLRVCFGGTVFEGYGMTESRVRHQQDPRGRLQLRARRIARAVLRGEARQRDRDELHHRGHALPARGGLRARPERVQGLLQGAGQDGRGGRRTRGGCTRATSACGSRAAGSRSSTARRTSSSSRRASTSRPRRSRTSTRARRFVAQTFVYGDSLTAVARGRRRARRGGSPALGRRSSGHPADVDFKRLCADRGRRRRWCTRACSRWVREAGLKGFEQVKAVHLHPELFSASRTGCSPRRSS